MFEKLTFAKWNLSSYFFDFLNKKVSTPNFANYLILAKVFFGGGGKLRKSVPGKKGRIQVFVSLAPTSLLV
jgi:hypothetical protein